ncbi:MAG: hypothetical protein ACRYFS_16500 [Janthinobacterium lividum]
MEPSEIWARACDRVRHEIADPTVWLAMQAAQPLLIDGSYFVTALPKQEEYLATHLLGIQANIVIEEALQAVAGRILAFRLIIGSSVADWNAEKSRTEAAEAAQASAENSPAEPPPAFFRSEATPPPAELQPSVSRPVSAESKREVSVSWEKLSDRLNQGYKSAPFIKYPHGQAQYVLTAVKMISDTIDALMPPPGAPREDAQERFLAKCIERLSGIVNLDPMFIALELLRYREMHGKNTDIVL